MDQNFDMASCTLKEDELLTKTEIRDIVKALTAEELASIEYFMKELEGFDKTRGTLKQGSLLRGIVNCSGFHSVYIFWKKIYLQLRNY